MKRKDVALVLCPLRAVLRLKYQLAVQVYGDEVKRLTALVKKDGLCSRDIYNKLHTGCEIARADVNRARVDLDTHIVEHQCGVE